VRKKGCDGPLRKTNSPNDWGMVKNAQKKLRDRAAGKWKDKGTEENLPAAKDLEKWEEEGRGEGGVSFSFCVVGLGKCQRRINWEG